MNKLAELLSGKEHSNYAIVYKNKAVVSTGKGDESVYLIDIDTGKIKKTICMHPDVQEIFASDYEKIEVR